MKKKFFTVGCGIVGTVNCTISDDVMNRMTDLLKHRGPDACGVWSTPTNSVRLGHRRLAIVGIDERGVQPHATTESNLNKMQSLRKVYSKLSFANRQQKSVRLDRLFVS